MCKCRSHGTFPLRLQSSHLNICYYHQDLHRRRPPARASRFCSDRRASYSSRPGSCPDGRYRSRASAPSIFGLVDSAVGHRNPLPVHPASPALLPKMAHLELSIPWDGSTKQPPRPTYLKFENRSRTLRPDASNHWLYPIELASELQLSRGKLRGNQLLDGSISLSPLYPSQTNDLHARSPWPPPEFLWLRPARHSSPSFGPDRHAHTQPFS
ncbi:hypothetical protein Bca4012_102683 [Brassica carinata]